MLPIAEDVETHRRFPVVTLALVLGMTAIALAVNGPGHEEQLKAVTATYGLVPKRLLADPLGQSYALVTYAFLHSGFLHLATNMLFLWVFGRGLENELGWAYLPFYLICGAAAGLASALLRPGSDIVTIGASGAISGVLGAYLVLLPNAEIRSIVLIPWLFVAQVLRGDRPIWDAPAWAAILTWVVVQIAEAVAPRGLRSGVDYGAHVGGFLAGYLIIRLLRAWFGLWPDEPTYRRILDVPAGYGRPLPNSYVRARRMIQPGVPIQPDDVEWISRSGYVDPDVVPGYDGKALIGRRLRAPRYRYEPIRQSDLLPAD